MNSEKIKEIKKDIEICTSRIECDGCSLISIMASTNCRNKLLKNCLTYIIELESENKTFLESKTMWKRLHTELCKENQKLKDRIAELENGIINIAKERNKKDELASKFIDSYNDSLKQFAERLKEKLKDKIGYDRPYVMRNIDETLKEFINGRTKKRS